MYGIADFDREKYDNAIGFLKDLAKISFIEKAILVNVKIEGISTMDELMSVMRDLYTQLKRKAND